MDEVKLCKCGCGLPAPISKRTEKKRGYIKGQPRNFIVGHNISKPVQNTLMKCAYCGKEKEMYPSDAERFKFCSRKCHGHYMRELTTCPNWTKRTETNGYIIVKLPEHPNALNGWVKEHRLVMSAYLGRPLENWEHVHHKNEIKTDNRIENLVLMSRTDHAALHRGIKYQETLDKGNKQCSKCEEVKDLEFFTKKTKGRFSSVCKDCYNAYRRDWRKK